ncbi:MAG: FkbM family methyltransferase [Sedimentibacter sp.]|uniref:FkbM family methyltransferase n=1 Tax=Sedimentibacter sp. TaxID=1960295 RepID=UPI0031582922
MIHKTFSGRQNINSHTLSKFQYDFNRSLLGDGYEECQVESIIQIYNALGDKQSQDLFNARLSYSLTKDFSVMNNYFDQYLLSYEDNMKKLLPEYISNPNANLYIFGAGVVFWYVRQCLPSIQWKGIIDNNFGCSGDILCGLPIMRFEEFIALDSTENTYIGIAVSNNEARKAIQKQIQDSGLDFDEHCFDLNPILSEVNAICEKQYFDFPGLIPASNEIFVDCGVFDGASSKAFIEWCNGNYKHVFAFEPDSRQYSQIYKTLSGAKNFTLFDFGCWDKSETITFFNNIPSQLSLANDKQNAGTTSIKVARMDDLIGDEKVTFIKMDIEGAEYQALSGAEQIIRKNKPRLAICVYHRPEDIIKIPELILSFRDDYKFYLRHPFYSSSQTVLFAI